MTLQLTPTLHDVAAAAGVSTATVSRCLNFPDKVAPATREKVSEAIAQLGYSPNFGAKVMAARRTRTIGAIIPTMENAIFARGLQAFQEELRLHGYTMLVATSSYDPAREAEQVRALIARGADGLLMIGHARDAETDKFIATQGVPALVTWAYAPGQTHPSVGFDNAAAMRAMARTVLDEGHTKLGFITAKTENNDRATARLAGINDAIKAAGLPATTLTVIETHYTIEEGANAFRRLMSMTDHPTAVLCGNDVLAVGALRAAHEMKVAIPQDVSIVGFDDIELAQVATPPLTTVHVPHREMGQIAARTLIAMLEDGAKPVSIALDTTIIRRGTLGPVRQKHV